MPIADNLLNRQFNPSRPNQIWVADITYIHTDEGWLFLAAIKDLYSCEIVGWAMDKQMTKQLVLNALRAAYWRKKPSAGLLHHSDRGSQYCSKAYRDLQKSYKMQTSMPQREAIHYAASRMWSCHSRKGDCWESEAYPLGCNAPMESFFGTLKNESLHHYRFDTREQARRAVFEYIEVFYNRIRRHAKIGNNSLAEYANSFYAKSFKDAA